MKLSNLTKRLAAFEPDGFPFISLYINAEADSTGRDNFQIWLKKQLAEKGKEYEENSFEAQRYDEAVQRINDFVDNDVDPAANGIAIFTTLGDTDFFHAVQLEVPFADNVMHSSDRPHIFPLVRAISQNPKYAVLWVDTNKADIYIFGGESRIRTDDNRDEKVEEIKNQVTNRSQVGGWSQNRYQRHIENFHLQHAKETVAELEELMRKEHIETLILCGDETTIMPILKPQLSKDLESKVIATLNMSQYDSVDEIREQTSEVLGIENATSDMKQVERTFDAARAAAGLGTLGIEATLKALSNGQVQELVISSDLDTIEYQPGRIERILSEYAPGEDHSSVETMPLINEAAQMADELIVRALNTDAEVCFIDDASLLEECGGVAAVLRYNMNATANG